jgi:hypothetical protein
MRSPFGVDDVTGSEWEWTADPADAAEPQSTILRGGSFDDVALFACLPNRGLIGPLARYVAYGIRICADAP